MHVPRSVLVCSRFVHVPNRLNRPELWCVHVPRSVQTSEQTIELYMLNLHAHTNIPLSSAGTWTPFHHHRNSEPRI